jgi:hypothetical protein
MFRFCSCVVFLLAAALGGATDRGDTAAGEELRVNSSLTPVGDDFRVNSAVYVGDKKTPASQSVTIFHEGVVYDSMKSPAETVVFNKTAKKFILLNMAKQIRAERTTDEVAAFVNQFAERLRSMIAKNPDPLIEFLADPKFQEQYDQPSGELTLSGPLVSYRVALLTGEREVAVGQYREFSDWYAKLNVLLTPGALPPFGRLAVNAAIANRKAIASQVVLTMSSPKTGRRQTIRSTHEIAHRLTPVDLDRVARIRKSMTEFKLVDFEKYRKSESK